MQQKPFFRSIRRKHWAARFEEEGGGLSKASVCKACFFRHADDKPTSEGAVKRLVEMRNLTAKAKEDFRLAPFIGIPWKPAWQLCSRRS